MRQTLVLIHGFPLDAAMWQPQLEAVPPGWRFIAPDLPGFGETDTVNSNGTDADSSITDYAADVIDLLDHLHIDTAVIGGVSMGGYVSFAIFRLAPRYFAGLVLSDTRAHADTDEGRAARRQMIDLVDREGAAAVARQMVPKLFAPQSAKDRPELIRETRVTIESASPDALKTAIQCLMTRPDSTPQLAQIHCPTLIIVGREDGLTPVADSETMHRLIPGSTLEIVEGAGHMPGLERPDDFNAALLSFLATRV